MVNTRYGALPAMKVSTRSLWPAIASAVGFLAVGAIANTAGAGWIQPAHLTISNFGAEGPDHVPGTSDDLPPGSLGISSGYNDGAYEAGGPPTLGAHVILLSTAVPLGGDIWQYSWTLVNRGSGNFIEYTDEGGGPNFLQAPPLEPAISFETDSRIGGSPETRLWSGRWYADVLAPGGATYYRPVPDCGNGIVRFGEECDDGNQVDGDGCDSNCTVTACGNAIVTAGEQCDDGGETASCDADCTAALCGDGLRNVSAGEECDDGNSVGGDCCAADCTLELLSCDDGNPCTDDGCDPGSGCIHVENSAPCDDGDACTQSDSCLGGSCVGADPVVCIALDQCHAAGVCDPASGVCSNPAVPDGIGCDDGDACTRSDSCLGGSCVGADPVVCIALDQCHAAGVCDRASGVCSNPAVPDGIGCDDGDACTQSDSCLGGSCVGADPLVCIALDQCHAAGVCDPASGACSNPAVPDGIGCDDGDACTQSDSCLGGSCVGADPVVCIALDQCHAAGVCDPASGVCSNPTAPDGIACDDALACTVGDVCGSGVCIGSVPPDCDDSNPCTQDSCNDVLGCINSEDPLQFCRPATRVQLVVSRSNTDARSKLAWKWSRGDTTTQVEFGDPLLATTYTLCLYDNLGGASRLATRAVIGPSEAWRNKDPRGWLYRDKAGTSDGVRKVKLKPGVDGKAQAQLSAKGVNFPAPLPVSTDRLFDQDPSVVVQLHNSEGLCWTSMFAPPDTRKNSPQSFSARSRH